MKNRKKSLSSIKLLLSIVIVILSCANVIARADSPIILASSVTNFLNIEELKGVVLSETGEPIPEVKVVNTSRNTTVYTTAEGVFEIEAMPGDKLEFSKVGYYIEMKVISKAEYLEVTLVKVGDEFEGTEVFLDDLVVTGYQNLDPNQAAGSYNQINMEEFEKKTSPNIVSSLEGLSPSLILSSNPSNPTGSKELTIRGVSTLAGSAEPLIVVDGFQYEGSLESINPYEVKSITLLKDAAASSIYGAKAANGVIVIVTKKGENGGTKVRYTSNLTFGERADLEYVMNRVSSNDLVNIQSAFAQSQVDNDNIVNYRYFVETGDPYALYDANATNRVYKLYSDLYFGYITQNEFDAKISQLRSLDNTQDLKDTYLQNPFIHQQNISLMGGNDFIKYRTSLNYTDELGNNKNQKDNRVLFDFVSDIKISKKFSFDFQSNLTLNNNEATPLKYNTDNPYSFDRIFDISSYDVFYDKNGAPLSVLMPFNNNPSNGIYGGKDDYEIQRLKEAGLLDETYYPAMDFDRYSYTDKNWSIRMQGMLNYELNQDITLKFGGQIQKLSSTTRNIANADSWYMRQLVNNTTPLDYTGDRRELNIPIGGRVQENRTESTNYLLRGQFDFDKTIDNHYVAVLLGSEIQSIKTMGTETDRLGYDPLSNLFLPVDYYSLGYETLENVYMPPNNTVSNGLYFNNDFNEIENRFFAIYANAQYVYDKKYIITGSARIDQSNLFGTDPEYRYKPFWSVGTKWRAGEENFLKDYGVLLDLRFSYGFNGNIANDYGPFDIANKLYSYRAGNLLGLELSGYKVPDLRWEQTGTTNIGIDTRVLGNRLDISFDYYRKDSKDILSSIEVDPTLGTNLVVRNDASIINNGYEISLKSKNINTDNFLWNTQLNFRYNEGEVKEIFFDTDGIGAYYYAGRVLNMKGSAPNSLFVLDYAGVNDEGYGLIRQANGDLVAIDKNVNVNIFNVEDLVEAGPTLPKYVAGLNNNFTYKNISLSFMFIYQGGHKLLKDSYNGSYINSYASLINSDIVNAWEKPGDENSTDIPKISSTQYSRIIGGSTKNVIDGDYLKLRDIVINYTLPVSFTKSNFIDEISINARAENLWKWEKNDEGIDPESQGLGYRTFPVQKSFTLGINVIF